MTGFGKATLQLPNKKVTVEIKSLNSKGVDLNMRLPSAYREMELPLRNEISTRLERGKIEFSLYIENTSEETTTKVNAPIIKGYIQQLKAILPDSDPTELMKMAVRMPDALKVEREEVDEKEWDEIKKTIESALEAIVEFRRTEGAVLKTEFIKRIEKIRKHLENALEFEGERIQTVKNRLHAALEDLSVSIDENRFEQELIFYLEKYDITEEKVRLNNHLNYFIETLNEDEANGRKLGFITQEIGREINTLGSKSNHSGMQKMVVLMKDELEKIKEQVLNIL